PPKRIRERQAKQPEKRYHEPEDRDAAGVGNRGIGPEQPGQAGEEQVREPEQQDRPDRIEQDSPPGVLEHIMADLVAGYGADLVERSILQRDVGNGDAG